MFYVFASFTNSFFSLHLIYLSNIRSNLLNTIYREAGNKSFFEVYAMKVMHAHTNILSLICE